MSLCLCRYAESQNAVSHSVVMLSVSDRPHNSECRHANCHYAECHYAECHYAECHYSKCHYAECHYAECRGATKRERMVEPFWMKT